MKNNGKILGFVRDAFFKTILPTAIITSAVLASVCPTGCRVTEESLAFLEGDFTVPKIISYEVVDESTVSICFSKKVTVPSATITKDPGSEGEVHQVSVETQDETKLYFVMENEMEVGKNYQLDGCVKDQNGNALSFSLGFSGFNARVPRLILNEVRNAYGKSSVSGVSHRKTEYVELLMLSDGNLFGVEIESANDGEKTRYTFPSVEVKKGDYVTVHMRQIPQADLVAGEVMADELEDNLALSYTQDTCSKSRDLWSSNTSSVFANSDIILVKSSHSGPILDSFVFAQDDKNLEESYPDFYAQVMESGTWEGSPFDSTSVTGSSVTRSMSRQNGQEILKDYSDGQFQSTDGIIANSKDQWLLTADKTINKVKYPGSTPGYSNSKYAYSK